MNELLRWLNSQTKNYKVGLDLLRIHSNKKLLIKMLESGEDHYNRERLEKAIHELTDKHEETKNVPKSEVITKEVLLKPSERIDANQEVQALIKYRRELYNEGRMLHARLELYQTIQERVYPCQRIVAIRKELKKLWKITNFYDENGRLPNLQEEQLTIELEELSDNELNQKFLQLYKKLRRMKNEVLKKELFEKLTKEAKEVRDILIVRDAFYHERFTLPDFEGGTTNTPGVKSKK